MTSEGKHQMTVENIEDQEDKKCYLEWLERQQLKFKQEAQDQAQSEQAAADEKAQEKK